MNPEDLMNMDPDQEEAYLAGMYGDDAPAAPAAGGDDLAAQQLAAAQAAQQPEQPQAPANDRDTNLGNLRRTIDAQNAQLAQAQALINDPNALQAHLARLTGSHAQAPAAAPGADQDGDEGPQLAIEDPAAVAAIAQQAIAPYLQTIQQLQAERAQNQQHQELMGLAQQYPDAPSLLMDFDTQMPQYAQRGMSARERYFLAHGVRASSPEYQAQLQRQGAVDATAAALGQPGAPGAAGLPTLNGVAPARANGAPIDPSTLDFARFNGMSDDMEERMLRGDFGG